MSESEVENKIISIAMCLMNNINHTDEWYPIGTVVRVSSDRYMAIRLRLPAYSIESILACRHSLDGWGEYIHVTAKGSAGKVSARIHYDELYRSMGANIRISAEFNQRLRTIGEVLML